MANIDPELLRRAYNESYYAGVAGGQGSGNFNDRGGKEFLKKYVLQRPLEIDPRVKYRAANLDAIKEFDATGSFSGTRTYAVGGGTSGVYFSQGQPLHQYAAGQLVGKGTARESSNPYLIATMGDNWGPSTPKNNLKLDQISFDGMDDAIEQRGMTEDVRESVISSRQGLEYLLRDLKYVKGEEQLQNWVKELSKTYEELRPHAGNIDQHLWGSDRLLSGMMFPSFQDTFGIDDINDALERGNKIPDSIEDILTWGQQLEQDSNEGNFRRDEARALIKTHIAELKGVEQLSSSRGINPKFLKKFSVAPYTTSSGRTFWEIPPWVKTETNKNKNTELMPSDTEILQKIKAGTASPAEVQRVYGLNALKQWGGGFGWDFETKNQQQLLDRLPYGGISLGASETEVLPRSIINNNIGLPTWSIPSEELPVGDYRPFAIWQYTKNGLRLINQGNNSPVRGQVPIPTGTVDPALIASKAKPSIVLSDPRSRYFNIAEMVKDLERNSGRRGFVAVPKFLEKGVGNLVMDAKVTMANADTFRTQYVNNSNFRSSVNKYVGGQVPKVAVGALAGLHLKSKIDEGMPIAQAVPVTAAEIGIGIAKFKLFDRFFGGVSKISSISDTNSATYKDFIAARKGADARREAKTKAKLSSYENSPVSDWPSHNPSTWMLNGQ